jgi:hypothetical protein
MTAKRKTVTIGAVALLILVLGAGGWLVLTNNRTAKAKPAPKQRGNEEIGGLEQPSLHSERPVAAAETAVATPTPVAPPAPAFPEPVQVEKDRAVAPMRIYASNAAPTPTPEEEGDYAPAYRMVRCKLVNTVDSSNISTPIIGLVTDDLVWGGKVLIAKCSEVHGVAQIDKSRERISADGAWTFTLYDEKNPGLGRELVVKGWVLDREDDPEFKRLLVGNTAVDTVQKNWGITDGSAGLRGVVIKSNNAEAIQMFIACFISGIAQSVQGYTTNIFGQAVTSPNARGAGGVPGYIINPAAEGTQAVMDRYAQLIMDSIERDGFFIRVPAGKLFYVYVTEPINTAKATVGGSRRRAQVESEYLSERERSERVSEPRSRRDEPQRNPAVGVPIDPALTHRLDDVSASLDSRAAELDSQSQALSRETKQKGKQ